MLVKKAWPRPCSRHSGHHQCLPAAKSLHHLVGLLQTPPATTGSSESKNKHTWDTQYRYFFFLFSLIFLISFLKSSFSFPLFNSQPNFSIFPHLVCCNENGFLLWIVFSEMIFNIVVFVAFWQLKCISQAHWKCCNAFLLFIFFIGRISACCLGNYSWVEFCLLACQAVRVMGKVRDFIVGKMLPKY